MFFYKKKSETTHQRNLSGFDLFYSSAASRLRQFIALKVLCLCLNIFFFSSSCSIMLSMSIFFAEDNTVGWELYKKRKNLWFFGQKIDHTKYR